MLLGNYTRVPQLLSLHSGACKSQPLKQAHFRIRALQQDKPLQLEKACTQQGRPKASISKYIKASQVVLVVKNLPVNAGNIKRRGFNPWVGKTPLEEGMAI